MPISKPFVVATEGRTMDGRDLPREWLVQAAANYDPASFTAVVNLDHYLAFDPESTFSAQGKVLKLTTQTAKILGKDRLQLLATVEASEAAVKLQSVGKKCFSSIEITPNFSDSGQAYLTGLALTDTPAALGTQAMKFSTFHEGEGLEHRALAQETRMEFLPGEPPKSPPGKPEGESGEGLLARLFALLSGKPGDGEHATTPPPPPPPQAGKAEFTAAILEAFAAEQIKLAAESARLKAEGEALKAKVAALEATLSRQDASGPQRPPAPGGANTIKTDC
ncbi:MAG: GPO family capsid scaffolding protein [Desulfobulbus sp.]|nr:GPO family capsid scaffolding protein [Desulfobulbus sp.]